MVQPPGLHSPVREDIINRDGSSVGVNRSLNVKELVRGFLDTAPFDVLVCDFLIHAFLTSKCFLTRETKPMPVLVDAVTPTMIATRTIQISLRPISHHSSNRTSSSSCISGGWRS